MLISDIFEQEIIRAWVNILALPEPAQSNAIEAFNQLAIDQRGEPELMGPGCGWEQNPAILHASGIWLHLIEHVGDLTNRMAKNFHVTKQSCGYGYVNDKVKSSLRSLRQRYGCEREINDQIKSNYRYQSEKGRYKGTFSDWESELFLAGKRYSVAHGKLKVYNEAQLNARSAAIALGKFNYFRAEKHLAVLEKHLTDPETWAEYAGLVMIDQNTQQPIPFNG